MCMQYNVNSVQLTCLYTPQLCQGCQLQASLNTRSLVIVCFAQSLRPSELAPSELNVTQVSKTPEYKDVKE